MNGIRKVTIQDIAREANVSISTVSRALNNGDAVTDEKREAVFRAVDKLGYQPNVFAQGLASGQSKTIGVLTPYISSPFYGEMMRGIVEGLFSSGYSVLFSEVYWSLEREREAIQSLLARRIDGLITLGGESSAEALLNISNQIPLIIIGRTVTSLPDRCLRINDFEGAYNATKFLIDYGHRRIVHITGLLSHQDASERLAGYRQALQDNSIEFDENLVLEGDFTEKSGLMVMQSLLLRGQTFSAVFAANDQMAYGARLALFRQGLRVPDDISLIGFDDQPGSAFMIPPLTTVRFPAVELGLTAARAVLDLLKGNAFTPPEFKANLILRESVARYR
ncbi:MAG: substrate-binding domain-containing protein [Anaerolineae bacterium]